jgi:hypothetical protein
MARTGHSTVYTRGLPAAAAALALASAGCSSNPLDGTWSVASTFGTFTATQTVDISSGGSLTVTYTATSSSCSGTLTNTGYQWAATASSITFSGTPVCTGSITCGALSLSCTEASSFKAGSCTYALSDDNDTLALTACSGTSDTTYIRAD